MDPQGVTRVHECAYGDAMATAHYLQVHEHLYALALNISHYDGIVASLKDNVVEVAELVGDRRRIEVTCVSRSDDGGNLWFYVDRKAVAPTGHPDAPMAIVGRLREQS